MAQRLWGSIPEEHAVLLVFEALIAHAQQQCVRRRIADFMQPIAPDGLQPYADRTSALKAAHSLTTHEASAAGRFEPPLQRPILETYGRLFATVDIWEQEGQQQEAPESLVVVALDLVDRALDMTSGTRESRASPERWDMLALAMSFAHGACTVARLSPDLTLRRLVDLAGSASVQDDLLRCLCLMQLWETAVDQCPSDAIAVFLSHPDALDRLVGGACVADIPSVLSGWKAALLRGGAACSSVSLLRRILDQGDRNKGPIVLAHVLPVETLTRMWLDTARESWQTITAMVPAAAALPHRLLEDTANVLSEIASLRGASTELLETVVPSVLDLVQDVTTTRLSGLASGSTRSLFTETVETLSRSERFVIWLGTSQSRELARLIVATALATELDNVLPSSILPTTMMVQHIHMCGREGAMQPHRLRRPFEWD